MAADGLSRFPTFEALESINGAIDAWIETAGEAGREIPRPVKAA